MADAKRSKNECAPPAPGFREQLTNFVEWIKPYKEVAALLVGLFVTISTGLAWGRFVFCERERRYRNCNARSTLTQELKRWPTLGLHARHRNELCLFEKSV